MFLTTVVRGDGSQAVADSTAPADRVTPVVLQYAQARVQVFEVAIKGRNVAADMSKVRVKQGDSVTIRWITDEATEVHLHGYNVKTRLEPGKPAEMKFEARATGRFAITSHGFGGHSHGHHDEPTLVYVEVYP